MHLAETALNIQRPVVCVTFTASSRKYQLLWSRKHHRGHHKNGSMFLLLMSRDSLDGMIVVESLSGEKEEFSVISPT
ncbi:hypothetical protein TNCV_4010941 [Trichonephila clavipes]|nr:hypothetical protein TNCV_4010941 [Trichonephila clavipes]